MTQDHTHHEGWSRRLVTDVPGPISQAMVDDLAQHECPAITARRARRAGESGVTQDPIVWREGRGSYIKDVDGNCYLDLTAAFAVSGYGHAHPELVGALHEQSSRLMHGMGDVFPTDTKIAFAKKLAEVVPGTLQRSIFAQSGAEAVEVALKTAAVYSGRRRILSFHNGYHGLSLGALGVTAYRDSFRSPFSDLIPQRISHAPYPYCYRCPLGREHPSCELACLDYVKYLIEHPATGAEDVGAVIVEPIQGRGGEIVPPPGWLEGLAALCKKHDVVLIFDEIYTGFARTGRRFALEHSGVEPDLLCLGKGMTGGFPMSAVIGTPKVMDAWGASEGESIHTSTFLGNPMGCAVGLKALELLERERYEHTSATLGAHLLDRLRALQRRFPEHIGDVRGEGLMIGVELITDASSRTPNTQLSLAIVRGLLERGVLMLPSGPFGQVLAFSPPFVITRDELDEALIELEVVMKALIG